MVCHSRRRRRHCLFLVILFVSMGAYCCAAESLPTSGTPDALRLSFPESGWVLSDLDGDRKLDFAGGQHLGPTKDGYFYRVQFQLSSDASSSSFTVVHNNALGLKIAAVDIDGDDDTDLIISDRFFGQHIGVWLNDGKGRFVKSLPGRFSPNSGLDLAFVAVELNWVRQPTVDKQQRRLQNYLPGDGYIQPLRLKGSALNQYLVEWLLNFAGDPLHQRAPPIPLSV